MFSYNDGLLGTPDSVGHFTGTVNGYKYFADNLIANEPIEDFVLNPLYDDQKKTMKDVLHMVIQALKSFILDGVEAAMNNFNSLTMRKKEVEKQCKV